MQLTSLTVSDETDELMVINQLSNSNWCRWETLGVRIFSTPKLSIASLGLQGHQGQPQYDYDLSTREISLIVKFHWQIYQKLSGCPKRWLWKIRTERGERNQIQEYFLFLCQGLARVLRALPPMYWSLTPAFPTTSIQMSVIAEVVAKINLSSLRSK